MPKPEFYVVYIGIKKINKEIININNEFFDGQSTDFNLSVYIITDEKISQMSIKNDIIKEYIDFTKIYDEERIVNSNKKEAIEKTIAKYINSNVLKDYLQDNGK